MTDIAERHRRRAALTDTTVADASAAVTGELEVFRVHQWLAKVGRLARSLHVEAEERAAPLLARSAERLQCL